MWQVATDYLSDLYLAACLPCRDNLNANVTVCKDADKLPVVAFAYDRNRTYVVHLHHLCGLLHGIRLLAAKRRLSHQTFDLHRCSFPLRCQRMQGTSHNPAEAPTSTYCHGQVDAVIAVTLLDL
jgi:hypothetical protein